MPTRFTTSCSSATCLSVLNAACYLSQVRILRIWQPREKIISVRWNICGNPRVLHSLGASDVRPAINCVSTFTSYRSCCWRYDSPALLCGLSNIRQISLTCFPGASRWHLGIYPGFTGADLRA